MRSSSRAFSSHFLKLYILKKLLNPIEPRLGLGAVFVIGFGEGGIELAQQVFLFFGELDRGFHHHAAHQVAGVAAVDGAHAFAAQAEHLAGLGLGDDLEFDAAVQGRHVQFTAQHRGGETDGDFAIEVVLFAREDGMVLDLDEDVEVARRAAVFAGLAFAGETDAVAGVHARGDLDRQGLAFLDAALAVAGLARVLDDGAAAVAAGTGLLQGKETLLHADLADTVALRALHRTAALGGAGAVAGLAHRKGGHADLHRGAVHRLFQVDLQVVAQVRAAPHPRLLAAARPGGGAEDVAEDIAEDVAEAAPRAATAPGARLDAGMAELIVGGAFARVGQYFIGLLGLLEILLGLLVVGIAVGVILHGEAPVGLFQFLVAGIAGHAQYFVVIAFCHSIINPGSSYYRNVFNATRAALASRPWLPLCCARSLGV
jgi:hypothetical protein